MNSPRAAFRLALGLHVMLIAGCGEKPLPLLDLKVSDGDWKDYHRSLELIDERQTPAERAEFAKALQELKYQSMATERQSPGPSLNAAIRAEIAGSTVRDILVLGHTIKVGRKRGEETALIRSLVMNGRRRARPGDEDSAVYLASLRQDQAKQLATLRAEIAAIEARLDELNPGRQKPETVVPLEELDEAPVPKT